MRTRGMCVTVAVVLCSLCSFGQVGVWKNYTAMNEVRAVDRSGDTYWAATSGGLFSWKEGSRSFTKFTRAEGLKEFDLTAVAVDRRGNVWSGSSKGTIHAYSPSTGEWRYAFDIATTNETNKGITRLVVVGDTLLICTNFGVSVFLIDRFQFGDTYRLFGGFPPNLKIAVNSAALFDGRFWVAATGGGVNRVAIGSVSNPNLSLPSAWTPSSAGNGLAIRSLTVFNNRMYAGTESGVYSFDGVNWVPVQALSGRNVVAAAASTRLLTICNSDRTVDTLNLSDRGGAYGVPLAHPLTSIALSAADKPFVGSQVVGVLSFEGTWSSHAPNGPASSQFPGVAVASNGVVWGASGSRNGKGFYRYDGQTWKSFTPENSRLPIGDYYRVSVACDGSAWASSWGRGVVEIPAGVDSVDTAHIFGRNIGMQGIPNDPTYIVASSVHCDSRGNTWFTSRDAANGRILVVRTPTGQWLKMSARLPSGTPITRFQDEGVDRSFAFDASGNVWAVVRDESYRGLVSFGNGGIRDTLSQSAAVYLTTGNGLHSNDVRTIVVDRDNNIWVGTDQGIDIILDPSNPTRPGGIASYRPLPGVVINSIAVDPLNQKWVGTTEGVVLLSKDGTQQLAAYTVANTDGKLIENDVKSIAIEPGTGTVYFGTNSGLASLTTTAVAPKLAFDELTVAPNPYRIPNAVPLTIDGLIENSTLKILSVDGKLMREIRTPGGRIGYWDGKDEKGNDVATGVYLVVAYSDKDAAKVGKGKIAVIRK